MNVHARFQFYWDGFKNLDPIPSYVITKSGISDRFREGSNVNKQTLERFNIPIPPTPDYTIWRKLVDQKKKCGRCYRTLRTTSSDYLNHRCF